MDAVQVQGAQVLQVCVFDNADDCANQHAAFFSALKEELQSQEEPEREQRPVNVEALRTAIELYRELSREKKKEFWSRVVGRIDAAEDGRFFVQLR